MSKPECYSPGRTKTYIEIAENDCFTCPERVTCLEFVAEVKKMAAAPKPKLTHLKPVKEYKKLECILPCQYVYWNTLEELDSQLKEFKEKLNQFKEEGWEGIMESYEEGHSVHYLYKTHLVEDEKYDKAITTALQNKPSWDDLDKAVMAIGLPLWECDYQYEWTLFFHTDPSNCSFVENRPGSPNG